MAITRGSDQGAERPLDGELTIGRDPRTDLTLEDAGVSRHHARLRVGDDGAPVVEDLGSANGTYVNGERIGAARRLADGDEVQIAAVILGPLSILLILTGSGSGFYAALPVAIAAIVCGSIGKRAVDRGRKSGLRGLALTGQVFGVVGTIVATVAIVALLILNAALDAGAESLSGLIDEVRSEIEGIPLPEDIQVPEDAQEAVPE